MSKQLIISGLIALLILGCAPTDPRNIDLSASYVQVLDFNSYFSAAPHGPTTNIFYIESIGAAVKVLPLPASISGEVYIFAQEDIADMPVWLNNQTSDGLVQAPEPDAYNLIDHMTLDSITLIETDFTEPGFEGWVYDVYEAQYSISAHTVSDVYSIQDFTFTTTLYDETAAPF